MMYSENLTNKELLLNAMPLVSLSRNEWNSFHKHMEKVEREQGEDSVIFKILETLNMNQSRLEVRSNYLAYFGDVLEEKVREESTELDQVI